MKTLSGPLMVFSILLLPVLGCNKKEPGRVSKTDANMGSTPQTKPATEAPPDKKPMQAASVGEKPRAKVPAPKTVTEPPKVSVWDQPVGPLPPKEKAIFASLKGHPYTVEFKRVDNQHYYKGNETRYDLWYKYIKDKGGAYVGVGPDQNYSFIAVAKPKLVVLMDYDIQVLATHKMYMLLTKKATTPDQVYEWLRRKYRAQFAKWAKAEYSPFWAKWAISIHKGAGEFVRKHHRWRLKAAKKDPKRHYWLSSKKLFDVWKRLVEAGRVATVLGDLRVGKTMTEIGDVLKKLGIKIQVQYFSNAEEFWFYGKPFKKSILNLPYGKDAELLRSVVMEKKYTIGFKFHYTIQKASAFLEWMRFDGGKVNSKSITKLHRQPLEGLKYLSRLPGLPDDAKK